MISTWKRTAIAHVASGFERGKSDKARASEAEICKLHPKIGHMASDTQITCQADGLTSTITILNATEAEITAGTISFG